MLDSMLDFPVELMLWVWPMFLAIVVTMVVEKRDNNN